jgi:MFS family permease
LAHEPWTFRCFRFLTGIGMGGQYAAINSTILELTPAHYRGVTVISVNGTFWFGVMLSALLSQWVLTPANNCEIGWRLPFVATGAGAGLLALLVMLSAHWIPESPRWLVAQGRSKEAEDIISPVEREAERKYGKHLPKPNNYIIFPPPARFSRVLRVMFCESGSRRPAALGLALMTSQAFLYNGIAFNYVPFFQEFYGISDTEIGAFLSVFALGNLLGPVTLGWLFEKIGRRLMITITYGLSGVLLIFTGVLFWKTKGGEADTSIFVHVVCWTVTFYSASIAASAAYLTVGETFVQGVRAKSIAVSFAFGYTIGGMAAPFLFETLIHSRILTGVLY